MRVGLHMKEEAVGAEFWEILSLVELETCLRACKSISNLFKLVN